MKRRDWFVDMIAEMAEWVGIAVTAKGSADGRSLVVVVARRLPKGEAAELVESLAVFGLSAFSPWPAHDSCVRAFDAFAA